MQDEGQLDHVFACTGPGAIVRELNVFTSSLPVETRREIARVCSEYTAMFGVEGALMRLRDRTASQILAEFIPANRDPLAAGEIDGIRYRLYDRPPKLSE